ncbi:MAG TPA: hypothetical protein P5056_02535 [Candidatus Paceibacterota bacterium]|nr:hypothetical protein [Candidatus Paceibacterota bacterium]
MKYPYLASREEGGPYIPIPEDVIKKIYGEVHFDVRMKKNPEDKIPAGVDFYAPRDSDNIDGTTKKVYRAGRHVFWITEEIARQLLPNDILFALSPKMKS